jgi:hypothetical protein
MASFVPGAYGNDGKKIYKIQSWPLNLPFFTAQPFSDFNTGVWTIFIVFLTADVGLSFLLFYAAKEVILPNKNNL